jgi:hypothetical protein
MPRYTCAPRRHRVALKEAAASEGEAAGGGTPGNAAGSTNSVTALTAGSGEALGTSADPATGSKAAGAYAAPAAERRMSKRNSNFEGPEIIISTIKE